MEIIVANDGAPEPILGDYPFPVTMVNLPSKDEAKNPCVPINAGVRASRGSVIVITNPEIYHRKAIFEKMLEELLSLGEKGYVLAACWGVESRRWHCHSTIRGPGQDKIPEGAGLHFCAMMHRKFFDEIEGFDEDYRDGAGYDDNDFIWRVHRGGGLIKVRDDLIVNHTKTGVKWKNRGRNHKIFHEKWADYWSRL